MTLRAEAIRLPRESPLGPAMLDSLAGYDLILVTGPNGAGKSTLLEPLRKSGRAGEVTCIDQVSGATVSYSSQGVQPSITFLESTDLMTEVLDLTQALALASNATRLRDESRLLKQMQNELQKAKGAACAAPPPQLDALRQRYLQCDAACGEHARTLEAYDELGSRLAARRAREWNRPDLRQGAATRMQAEQAVCPEVRTLVGMSELRPCLAKLRAMALPDSSRPSEAENSRQSETRLLTAVDAALRCVPGLPRPPAELSVVARAQAVLAGLRDAHAGVKSALAAKDLLRECRLHALKFIEGELAASRNSVGCPVCERPVDAAKLPDALRHQTALVDDEMHRWTCQMKEIEAAGKDLRARVDDFESAARLAGIEHGRVRDAIVPNAPRFRPAEGWAPSVCGVAEQLRAGCEAWAREHAARPGVGAMEAARQLVALASTAQDGLEAEERRLNGDLPEAQSDFRALQALGAALSAREELDALDWHVSLDLVDADRRASAQRGLWLKVLREMCEAREAHASSATTQVVHDPGVQARFQRMLARVRSRHPTLVGLGYLGASVHANGQDLSQSLSEGQRVIVNIAAALAVVGKVAGTEAHKPGWIVFDEPSNGLDEAGRDAVAAHLGGFPTTDVPSQIFVATFDEIFALRLIDTAKAVGRRVKHVALPEYQRGRAFAPCIRTP